MSNESAEVQAQNTSHPSIVSGDENSEAEDIEARPGKDTSKADCCATTPASTSNTNVSKCPAPEIPDLQLEDVYTSLITQKEEEEEHPMNIHSAASINGKRPHKEVSSPNPTRSGIAIADTKQKCCFSIRERLVIRLLNFCGGGGGMGSSKGYIRYLILLISILCMTSTRSNDLSFNFTVICMTHNSSDSSDDPIEMKPRELSAIFAGSGVGAIAMVLPVVYALHFFGARLVFGTVLMWSALATFSLPILARISPLWMLPARIVQGLALSAVLPLMGCISAEWAPLSEIGKFMTLLSSAGQLSQILTMPLSAQLCVKAGWSSVFYVHGTISALLASCFLLFYRSSPRNHPCVNAKELQFITQGARARNKKERRVPYPQILRSKHVWAVWVAFLGNSFGFQLIVQFMPTFLNKVLNVPIAKTGMVAIIPPITQLFVKVCAGYASDRIRFISELTKLRLFNSIAMVGCGAFLLPLGYLSEGSESMLSAMLCFTSSISCLGMVACSSMKSATLVARNFTHFVMGVVQLVVCVGMLLVPIVVNWLAPNNLIQEWRSVFLLVFTILFLSNLFFCRYCSAEAASWALGPTDTSPPLIFGEDCQQNEGTLLAKAAPTKLFAAGKEEKPIYLRIKENEEDLEQLNVEQ